jgi:hypothetical protein
MNMPIIRRSVALLSAILLSTTVITGFIGVPNAGLACIMLWLAVIFVYVLIEFGTKQDQ